jgi:hypothetical protein
MTEIKHAKFMEKWRIVSLNLCLTFYYINNLIYYKRCGTNNYLKGLANEYLSHSLNNPFVEIIILKSKIFQLSRYCSHIFIKTFRNKIMKKLK